MKAQHPKISTKKKKKKKHAQILKWLRGAIIALNNC
jgi:hypothetical protein